MISTINKEQEINKEGLGFCNGKSRGVTQNNRMEISLYENICDVQNGKDVSLYEFLDDIREGKWIKSVVQIRSEKDNDIRRELKKGLLPCVTISGLFDRRSVDGLQKHSGLICMDLDKLSDVDCTKGIIESDPYTFATFLSASKSGLAVIVQIVPEKHLEAYYGLEKYYKDKYGITIDRSCKDVSRARFVSCDHSLFVNHSSTIFENYITKSKAREEIKLNNSQTKTKLLEQVKHVVNQVKEQNILLGDDSHGDWTSIGFALADGLGEHGRTFFHQISSISEKYNYNVCDKQFTDCLKAKKPDNKITISTLFHYANKAGISIVTVGTEVTGSDKRIIPVCAFPFEILPDRVRTLINNFGTSLHVDSELVATSLFPIMGGMIGNAIKISPKAEWNEPPFIWLNIIASTGYGKTPAINTMMKPINEMQGEEYNKYVKENKKYEKEEEDYKALSRAQKLTHIKNTQKPRLKHLSVSDFTIESLVDVFESTPRGVIVYKDELSGLILGLNQYKGNKGSDKQHLLELFNAKSWKIDRKSEGSKYIPNTGASIIGGMPPEVMTKVFGQASFDDGFLPRFLQMHTDDKPQKFSRVEIKQNDLGYLEGLLKHCHNIPLNEDENGFVVPMILKLDSDALDSFEEFYNEYNKNAQFISNRVQVFIPKLITYCLRFALILHVLESFSEKIGNDRKVNLKTMQNAIKLTRFFAGQVIKAINLYGGAEDNINGYQKRLIETLCKLKEEVKYAKLPLSRIVELFNKNLNKELQHTSEGIKSLLKDLNLDTKKGTGNKSELIWETEKINILFTKIAVTSVPTVTQKIK